MKYGGYERPFDASDGLRYRQFTEFLKGEFGIESRVSGVLLPRDIMKEIAAGNYVIVSVSPQIRDPKARPRKKGGHLILIKGYDLKKQHFVINNPSGDFNKTQQDFEIRFKDFRRFFAGRGIVIQGV